MGAGAVSLIFFYSKTKAKNLHQLKKKKKKVMGFELLKHDMIKQMEKLIYI